MLKDLFKFAPMFLLVGCSSHLQELKALEIKPENFSGALAVEYMAYSESEAEQGKMQIAEHFANKGLQAAKGEYVAPDEVAGNSNIYDFRSSLIDMLSGEIKNAEFLKAARTQLLFDCWNNQESEKNKNIEVSCAEEFERAYNELQEIVDSTLYGDEYKNSINFISASTELDDEEKKEIEKIAARLKNHKGYTIELRGYADALGKGALAKKRMATIRKEIIRVGIPKNRLTITTLTMPPKSDVEVKLSSDVENIDHDKVDIIITSSKHIPGGSND